MLIKVTIDKLRTMEVKTGITVLVLVETMLTKMMITYLRMIMFLEQVGIIFMITLIQNNWLVISQNLSFSFLVIMVQTLVITNQIIKDLISQPLSLTICSSEQR